jgi:hypothetical protein
MNEMRMTRDLQWEEQHATHGEMPEQRENPINPYNLRELWQATT